MQDSNKLGAEGAGHLAGALAGMTGMQTLHLVRVECIFMLYVLFCLGLQGLWAGVDRSLWNDVGGHCEGFSGFRLILVHDLSAARTQTQQTVRERERERDRQRETDTETETETERSGRTEEEKES